MDGLVNENDSEFEVEGKNKKAAKRGPRKVKPTKWETSFTEDVDTEKINKRAPPKQQKKRPQKEQINPNMVKSSNRLIGEIENKDLYMSDDDNGINFLDTQPIKFEVGAPT